MEYSVSRSAEQIIEAVGGLDKARKAIHSNAKDDVFDLSTQCWYTSKYWHEKLKRQLDNQSILLDQVIGAMICVDTILHIGGSWHNKLVYFSDNGQREFQRLHEIPMPSVKNHDQYSQYASVNAVQDKVGFDTYRAEVFTFDKQRRLFLIFVDLFNDQDSLKKLVKEHWNYGFRI